MFFWARLPTNATTRPFSSTPFKFIIEDKPFFIHAGLLAKHSKALHKMISSPMKEREQGYARLEDVTAANFQRFLEWVYGGYYNTPEPEHEQGLAWSFRGDDRECLKCYPPKDTRGLNEAVADPAPTLARLESSEDSMLDSIPADKPSLQEAFLERQYQELRNVISLPPARANKHSHESYQEIFLCHAQIYVFADKYRIDRLKVLAVENLHATLAIFKLYEARIGDIISLLRYAYANKTSSSDEPLRDLLKDYMALHVKELSCNDGFKDAICEAGEPLLGDYMAAVMKII